MVDWPTGLVNVFKLQGATDRRMGAKIRSENDVGPANVRRRYTIAVRNVDVPVNMSNAERVIFDAFYIDDLEEGTLRFNWTDPVDGTTVAMRFRSVDGPSFAMVGGGNTKRWSATFEMEIIP